MSAQQFPIYAINIDRAADRMQEIREKSAALSLTIERVVGTDGKRVPREEWIDVDHAGYRRRHGRIMLDGEYGCYRSHLAAIDRFLASGRPAAVIIEDDVVLNDRFQARVAAALDALPKADVIRLVSHRSTGFRATAVTREGDAVGRCYLGPQGSAACYLLTRAGAAKLQQSLQVMTLPFDVALERGWATGVSVYTMKDNFLGFTPLADNTMIGARKDYRATKLPQWRRIPAHLFRTADFFRRLWYVFVSPGK